MIAIAKATVAQRAEAVQEVTGKFSEQLAILEELGLSALYTRLKEFSEKFEIAAGKEAARMLSEDERKAKRAAKLAKKQARIEKLQAALAKLQASMN